MHINICITGWGCYLFFNFWLCIATNIMKIELYPTQYMFFIAKTNIFLKNIEKNTKKSLQIGKIMIYYKQEIREGFEISFLFHYNSPPKTKRCDEKNSQLLIVFAFIKKLFVCANKRM